jgi:hypothetical protein
VEVAFRAAAPRRIRRPAFEMPSAGKHDPRADTYVDVGGAGVGVLRKVENGGAQRTRLRFEKGVARRRYQ